jgi:hypothetical protein
MSSGPMTIVIVASSNPTGIVIVPLVQLWVYFPA